jgi:hypothetical protein
MEGVGTGIDQPYRFFPGDLPGSPRPLWSTDVSDVLVRRAGVGLGNAGDAVIGHVGFLSGTAWIPGAMIVVPRAVSTINFRLFFCNSSPIGYYGEQSDRRNKAFIFNFYDTRFTFFALYPVVLA